MNKTIHRASTRGYFNYGWLKTNHTFSFNEYYNPDRMGFGKLRVLNDDFVAPGQGFGTHPHKDMEIVSIPLSGELAHKDSTGSEGVILPDDVQVMSAGTGILHSEYNHSNKTETNFLQLWIFPDRKGHKPRYDQKSFNPEDRKNKILNIVSPFNKNNGKLWLNQEAYLSMTDLDKSKSVNYKIHTKGNGVYIFVINGLVSVTDEKLSGRDGIGITDTDEIILKAEDDTSALIIEVPMK